MSRKTKILIVDDEPRMCESLRYLLSLQDYEIFTALSGREALLCLSENQFDVALLDILLPDMSGHQLMDHIKAHNADTSVIVITGNANLDSALQALRKGAYDYLRKPFEFDELLKTVQNALDQKRLKSEKEEINKKLNLTEERYRFLVQNSPDIIYTLDEKGNFTFISSAAERLLGYKIEELIGKHYSMVVYDEDLDRARWFFNERRTEDRTSSGIELRLKIRGNGRQYNHYELKNLTIELKSTGIFDRPTTEKDKRYIGTQGVIRDITDRKLLQAQLEQAERMEALGALSGGIAHDFNNLLMGIQGNISLILLDLESHHPRYQRLKNIEEYVKSGTELTKQLLGFARGGKYIVKPADINELIEMSSEMFGRTKKEISIQRRLKKDIRSVEIDRGQIEQVLINLYVNAWHAMPEGGELLLETDNVELDDEEAGLYRMEPGKYVKISVRDTGVGIDEETQKRIFEPFFTTREMGRGSGLGLASAYGIVTNHNGVIKVNSNKGQGTTFTIYLPASGKQVLKEETFNKNIIIRGSETVLLIDDEEMIIDVGKAMLEEMGYNVLTARNGKEAAEIMIRFSKQENGPEYLHITKDSFLDLVILDMIMPDMGGGETYEVLKSIDPEVKVLLSSGYSIDGLAGKLLERGCDGFIQKPFNIQELSVKLREVLDR